MSKSAIVLASQSAQRLNLFKAAGLEFTSHATHSDEKSIQNTDVNERAQQIALLKATAARETFPDAIIVAADTFLTLNDRIYEKPTNLEEAVKMLQAFSGNTFTTYTGLAILANFSGEKEDNNFSTTVTNTAKFRTLSDIEIEHYVQRNPVTTWAGGFSPAYDAGANLIEWVEGSLTSFTHGIPMEIVLSKLQELLSEAAVE